MRLLNFCFLLLIIASTGGELFGQANTTTGVISAPGVTPVAPTVGIAGQGSGVPRKDAAELGIPAPELQIATWVKGTTVSLAAGEGEKIHVVEFWATWCPPCRDTIPHLTELQEKYRDKGVIVVGISDEEESKVRPFVERQGDKMNYTVAIDKNDQTANAYMKTFGVRGIPHAFVVDKEGRIAWRGHPMAGLDKVLDQIIAGTYDIEKANRSIQASNNMRTYFQLLETDAGKATELGEQILADGAEDPMLLNDLAWRLASSNSIKNPDLELAERAAKRAVDITNSENASILDTYARVLFEKGKIDEAIRYQSLAVEKNKEPREAAGFKSALERYQSAAKQKKE